MPRRRVPIRQSELVRRFAERLREVRQSRGMTQVDLARKANVTPSYLSRLEGGKVAPGIDMVERLAGVLGITPAELLPHGDFPDPLPVLKEQAREMTETLFEKGDQETFRKLNPLLALLVEAATKRR